LSGSQIQATGFAGGNDFMYHTPAEYIFRDLVQKIYLKV
jgi:hypothetical protein